MEVVAENSYLITHSRVFDKKDFTGYIAHLNQDGELLYGVRLENGKFSGWINSYAAPSEEQAGKKNARTSNCGYQYGYSTGFNVTVVWVNVPCVYTPSPGAPYYGDWEQALQYDYEQTQAMYEHMYCMEQYGVPCLDANKAIAAEQFYKVDGVSLDPCPQGELHKMYISAAHDGKMTEVIDNFFENPRFVWIVKSGNLTLGVGGETGVARQYVPGNSREPATMSTIVSTMDRAFVAKCTNLALQAALVHELVHAHLEMEYKSSPEAFEATYPQFMPEFDSTHNTNDKYQDLIKYKILQQLIIDYQQLIFIHFIN